MKVLRVSGRCAAQPPAPEWRAQLAQMLGAKPRRMSLWAELALYGALRCLAEAGETSLPSDAQIWLGSHRGTYAATADTLAQSRDDLPMPLLFLQTQPSQLLALLGAHAGWIGQACFVAGGAPEQLLQLAVAQMGAGGLLLGWVDEMEGGTSNWVRLCLGVAESNDALASSLGDIFNPNVERLLIAETGLTASILEEGTLNARIRHRESPL